MKLATSIPPRRDGTVIARGADGTAHVFRRAESGDLECDVTDRDLVAMLLSGGMFYPVDPADYEDALEMAQDDEDDEGSEDDEGGSDLLPVESETPPKPRRGRPPKSAAAKG